MKFHILYFYFQKYYNLSVHCFSSNDNEEEENSKQMRDAPKFSYKTS